MAARGYVRLCVKTLALLVWVVIAVKSEEDNDRPLVGIVAMKITDSLLLKKVPKLKGRSYIAASYVKLIEMAGARAVPIRPRVNDTSLRKIFKSLNGLVFPGGEINLKDSGYYKVTKKLYKWAVEENEKGKTFPILGICRGMQALAAHSIESLDVFIDTDAVNYTATMKWNDDNFGESYIKEMPAMLKDAATEKKVTSQFHRYGISPDAFEKGGELSEQFNVIATSKDRKDKEFVSIMQGKKMPFYGLQFHPEKVLFEWAYTVQIPHSIEAIFLSQFLANAFMGEVRKNTNHGFKNPVEEETYTMSKDPVYYTGFIPDMHSPFMQIYMY